MRNLVVILLVLFCVGLVGCATVGREVQSADISKIEIGKTTYADAVDIFGLPRKIVRAKDGTAYVWAYGHSGPFGIGKRGQGFVIIFDENGKARDYKLHDTAEQSVNKTAVKEHPGEEL